MRANAATPTGASGDAAGDASGDAAWQLNSAAAARIIGASKQWLHDRSCAACRGKSPPPGEQCRTLKPQEHVCDTRADTPTTTAACCTEQHLRCQQRCAVSERERERARGWRRCAEVCARNAAARLRHHLATKQRVRSGTCADPLPLYACLLRNHNAKEQR